MNTNVNVVIIKFYFVVSCLFCLLFINLNLNFIIEDLMLSF